MKISNETKIGILTAFSITIFILGFNFLKGNDFFQMTDDYYAVYDHTDGLDVSNPVLYNGFKIGRVKKLTLTPEGRIIATFNIKSELSMPKNSIAKIISADLLGSKAVIFVAGNSTQKLVDGDTLFSAVELSLTQSVNSQVIPVKEKAERLMVTLDSIFTSINAVLNPEFTRNVNTSIASISRSLQSFEKTIYKVDTLVNYQAKRLQIISANIESITTNLKNNNQRLSHILANIESITDSLVKANLLATVMKANRTLDEVAKITEKINKGEGSLGLLINDTQLYNNLNSSATDLDKLILDIKKRPKRYVNFSILNIGSGKRSEKEK